MAMSQQLMPAMPPKHIRNKLHRSQIREPSMAIARPISTSQVAHMRPLDQTIWRQSMFITPSSHHHAYAVTLNLSHIAQDKPSISLEPSQIRHWVNHVPMDASLGIQSLPSAAYSVVSSRTSKTSVSRGSNLTSSHSVLTGIAGVKVRHAGNEAQRIGGLSDHEEMDGEELEEWRQSPVKGNRRVNSNVSNIYCSPRPRHN